MPKETCKLFNEESIALKISLCYFISDLIPFILFLVYSSYFFIVVTSGSFDLCINEYFKSLKLKKSHFKNGKKKPFLKW